MADLGAPRAPFQILAARRRRSRGAGFPSEAPLGGPAPCAGVVATGWLRRFEPRGIELAALFGWVGNGR
jgi:hypothetical protein